jgi:hypothetical protein
MIRLPNTAAVTRAIERLERDLRAASRPHRVVVQLDEGRAIFLARVAPRLLPTAEAAAVGALQRAAEAGDATVADLPEIAGRALAQSMADQIAGGVLGRREGRAVGVDTGALVGALRRARVR